ncbi:MAG: serine/threonine protein kinase [Chloroflexi bacterium]|nr:MAG: serine/threonine protein kinase [Chloroflexota bacterium]
MPDHEGQQLGNYRLVRSLGQGGFAHVYLGEHIHLRTLAAVKVLDTRMSGSDESLQFRHEARVIADLHHPNIVRVLDFSVIDDTPFLVMEYAPNGTLAKRHPRGIPLPPVVVVSYVKQVAAALQYAHTQKRLIHLDVKPANMLIGSNDEILLSDFGIALTAISSRSQAIENILGTLPYMSPEHLNGKPSLASDQYSLGVVAYEWLCGSPPFQGSHSALFAQHSFAPPPSLQSRMPGIPSGVDQIVLRALAKQPQQRFPSVQDFADALEEAVLQALQAPGAMGGGHAGITRPSPSSTTQQVPPRIGPSPFVVGSPAHTGTPFGQTEQVSEPVVTPLPNTGAPEHPLVLQERVLIRQAQTLEQGYELRKTDLQRRQREEEQVAYQARQSAMSQADQAIEEVRQIYAQTRSELSASGWNWWAKARIFTPPPEEPARSLDAAIQVATCHTTAAAASDRVSAFLRRYARPGVLFTWMLRLAAVVAVIFGLLLLWASGSPGSLLLDAGWALIVFIAVLVGCFYWLYYPLRKAYVTLTYVEPLVELAHQERCASIEDIFQTQLHEIGQRLEEQKDQLEHILQERLMKLRADVVTFLHETSYAGAGWDDASWDAWETLHITPAVARIGALMLPAQLALPPLPALISCPEGCNLFIKAAGAAKQSAAAVVQSLLIRLLATQQPGNVRLTIIDPIELENTLNPFSPLAEHHTMLGTGNAWVSTQEIEQQLRGVTDHIRHVHRKRSEYRVEREKGEEDNESSLQAEPYHILVVMGFPANFSPAAANDLLVIARNGPRCGVSTIVVGDLDQPFPALLGLELHALERISSVITGNEQHFSWLDPDFSACQLQLDTLPPLPLSTQLLQTVRQYLSDAASVEYNTRLKELLDQPQWPASGDRVKAWLGHPVILKEPTAVTFSRESGSHLLIVGKQEEMAMSIAVTSLVSLAAQCPPQRLQCYIVDTNSKQDVLQVVGQLLPGYISRVVTRQNLHSGLAQVITYISDVLEQRRASDAFEHTSILLILHGLQRMDELRQKPAQHEHAGSPALAERFATILHQGPDLGIHLLMWCDRLTSLKSMPGSNALEHFDRRVVFRTPSKNESMELLEWPGATELSQDYAVLFDTTTGEREMFRPYHLPSREWLEEAAEKIGRKILPN